MMKKMEKISCIMYAAAFFTAVVVLGFLSFGKLVGFYVNEELDYNEWSADLGSKLETDIATSFFEKFQFVNLNGAVRNFLGQHEMNGVVKLNNGYLTTLVGRSADEYLLDCAASVAALDAYLKARGTALVYAATPLTQGKYDSQMPYGVEDYGNMNVDRLLMMLEASGVDTIDFREKMYADGINHYDMMYKTDHHWTTEAGFYAYGILEDYIVEKIGCKADERVSDIRNYTVTTYKEWHLGSRGQRTGIYYAGIDDFKLILPNFETSIQNGGGDVGSMQEMAVNMEPLGKKQYTSRYTYDWVLGGSCGNYVNLNSKNDAKILIISDSFAKAVNPYLMMGFKEINYIYDLDVSCVTPEYIEEYDPDVVVLMYYSEILGGGNGFNFQGFR